MSNRPLVTMVLVLALVFATAVNAMAATAPFDLVALSGYGTIVSNDELDLVEGELGPLAAGAIVGAIGGAFRYGTSPGEKSLLGLGGAVAAGAALGVVTGAAMVLGAVATSTTITTTAAKTAWSAFSAANVGALEGALEHLIK